MHRVICSTLLFVVLASTYAAEQNMTVDVDLVNVYFTVCNKKGRLIPHLGPENFAVYEDESRQVITHFSRETDLPLTLALLIDTSGSIRYKLNFEQAAAIDFLNSTLRQGRDNAAVYTFDSTVDLRQDFTDSPELLASAIQRTRSGGGTRLYDALNVLLKGPLSTHAGRRGIILLTDGDDNSSRTTPSEVLEAAQRGNVTIYAISVNSFGLRPQDSPRTDGVLERFATETGGKAFFPEGLKELPDYFRIISNELRSQYTIGYRSTNPSRDGTFRKLRIEAKEGHYSVHSRTGYYAPL
jgi:VWFA-related protein